jgi:hypothetical protein
MKVSELIQSLQKLDPTLPVLCYSESEGPNSNGTPTFFRNRECQRETGKSACAVMTESPASNGEIKQKRW